MTQINTTLFPPDPDPVATRLRMRRKILARMDKPETASLVAEAIVRADTKSDKLIVGKINEILDIFRSNATTANKLTALAVVEKLTEPNDPAAFAAIKDELRD